jgi:sugar lactone lactonase YvrE
MLTHSSGSPRRSGLVGPVVAVALAAAVLVTGPAPGAGAATWTAPGFVRSFGGRGEAGLYAWGMAYDPVTNEVLAGDYWNFKVRRYDLNGNLLGSFFRAVNLRKGQPYSISVDGRPGKGDIYVSEISDTSASYFAHYTAQGQYLGEFNAHTSYNAWHTIAGHYLYVSDTHYPSASRPPKVRVYDLDDNDLQVLSFGSYGTTPNTGQMGDIHGIAVDASGRIYVADTTNRTVHVFTPNGSWLYDFGSAGKGVGQFSGDLRGMVLDQASGGIYVVDANDGQVEKFQMSADPATTPPTAVAHWGSVGTGSGQMGDGGRGITVDGEGNIWVADYGNYRMLKFSPSGTVLGTFPDPAMPPPPGGFSWARDVGVDPQGNVWAADARNNRFQKFGPDGTFLGTWGRRNSSPPYGMDYPRGLGIEPTTGNVWVSSTRDHFIRVYDSSTNYIGTAGNGQDSTATGSFRWPLDVEFVNEGGTEYAWIADYTSGRLKRVDTVPPFTERQSISVTNNGVAFDPSTDRLYVVSWRNDNVSVYDASSGSYITRWGQSGSGPCQFTNPWDIDLIDGTLYVTDSDLSRVTAFSTGGTCLGQWGTKGTGPYQLKDPSGITHDAQGNIYVADANNDRVVEYSFSVPLPDGSDVTSPTVSIASPSANQVFPAAPVTISGTAGDDVAVASVFFAVKDRVTNLWWNTKDGVWGTAKTWNYAAVTSPTVTSVTYAGTFTAEAYGGSYTAQTESMDTSGHTKVSTSVNFKVQGGGPIDSTPPGVSISSPTNNQVLPAGAIPIGGAATDDVAVATVEVAIRDRVSGLWWQPGTGTWGASLKWFSVPLDTPGASSTTWSTTWNDAASGGSYRVQARSTDTSDNVSITPYPAAQFTVS